MDILKIDFRSPNAPKMLVESLHTTGFAVFTHHPLDTAKIEAAYQEWRSFFNSDAKYRYDFNPETQAGYLGKNHYHQAANSKIGVKDLKEVYQLYVPHGPYPSELSSLPKELFYEKFDLGKKLLQWIESESPPEVKTCFKEPLANLLSMERTLYRAIHYPPVIAPEIGAVRAAAHEDFGLITILPAATESGLQVLDKQGRWHEVSVDPDTLIINAGGTLQEASNHYFRSTVHQVVNPEGSAANRARLSLPMFLHGRRDAYLSERFDTVGQYFDMEIQKLALNHEGTY